MVTDFGIFNKDNNYALYTPAISASYMSVVSQWEEKIKIRKEKTKERFPNESPDFYERTPPTLSPDARELNFLDQNNTVMKYNAALYSAGHACLFNEKNRIKEEAMLYTRNRDKTVVISDSSGYQIASNAKGSSVSGFDWSDVFGEKSDKIRMAILRWQEKTSDYSMTLDFPTHSIDNPYSNVKSFKDCLESSLYNYNFILKNRIEGETRWLNILQGRNMDEANIWWDNVKNMPFEGWAFGGANTKNFVIMLKRLIVMRDEKYLNETKNWIHVLGTSRLASAYALTTILRTLQENVAKNITVSYDSSTAFFSAATGQVFSHANYSADNLGISCRNATWSQVKEAVRSKAPYPFYSPVSKYLTIGDVATRDPIKWGTTTTWDQFSYELVMWNNLGILLTAIQMVNHIHDLPVKDQIPFIPEDLLWFHDFCPEVFKSETPFELIDQNKSKLTKLVGVEMNNMVSQIENEEFFESTKQTQIKPDRRKIYKADKPKPAQINEFFTSEDGSEALQELSCYNEIRRKA